MESTKDINNKSKVINLDEQELKSSEPSLTNNSNVISNQREHSQKKKKLKYILFPFLILILVGIVIIIVILSIKIHKREENKSQNDPTFIENLEPEKPHNGGNEEMDIKDQFEIEKAYKIITNVNDLKRIYINQRYYEDIKISGSLTKRLVVRKTNYDIYVITESESDEKMKNFYNKIYTCSISIESECISTKDEYCLPRKLVDLNDQDYSNVKQINRIESLENFALPLCIFNMTDNNIILSVACHKNISNSRVNSIILDLYSFRPRGIKRINKKVGNITITQKTEGDYEYVRETNGGICDVENSIGTFCTIDMNTKKDKNGNLISYDELAFINITKNEDNYYIKNKITSLSDKTNLIKKLNPFKYNETLNEILPYLKEYMKVYELFSTENFEELYYVSKGLTNLDEKRRLNNEINEIQLIYNDSLFNYEHFSGMNLAINLSNNLGLNTQTMEASSSFIFDNEKYVNLGFLKQYTNMSSILKEIKTVSTSGINLANNLYTIINEIYLNLTKIINTDIPSLNSLVKYKELTEIFDYSSSLDNLKVVPFEIFEESNKLVNKLEQIYNEINNGSLKNNFVILNEYIYIFITQSHILIDKIYNNLNELNYLIKSPKEAISVISTYYLNHTSYSYISTIEKAREILLNYYENEVELIVPKVGNQINLFENTAIESIQKQLNLTKKLIQKIENRNSINFLINGATKKEDYEKISTNLENSNNYIEKIINLFQDKVKKEMDLKNGYFITKYDIDSNNNRFKEIINESLEASLNIENNEYIDKEFDKIMTDLRLNFSSIMNEMKYLKENKFFMNENTLQGEYFSKSELDKMSSNFENLTYEILLKIKHENDLYINTMKNNINKFLKDNKEYLDNLIKDLEYLFSEKMDQLEEKYKIVFNKHLESINNVLNKNKELAKNYFSEMNYFLTDDNIILNLLGNNNPVNKTLPSFLKCIDPNHCWGYSKYTDKIYTKSLSQLYYDKYRIFQAKINISKEFINDELNSYILEEYKKIITNVKQLLHNFKNNKMTDKFPEFSELYFIDENIKKMDDFFNALNRHISDEIFNEEYMPLLNELKQNKYKEMNDIKNYIENVHIKIKTNVNESNLKDDFCIAYQREKIYASNCGAIYYIRNNETNCFKSNYTDNYKYFDLPSFEKDIEFEKEVTNTYQLIKQKIDSYTNKINELKNIITTIESNIRKMDLCKDYFSPIQEKLNLILSEKYSDNLIKGSYKYHKKIIDNNLENILKKIENKWINSLDILGKRIDNHFDKFKYSVSELGLMSLIYDSLIYQNITNDFYDSIISHQRTEFNYTISFYYNCLIQYISSCLQFIYNQIPTNQEGFNNITNFRKKEVNNLINKLINDINESKNHALSLEIQLDILGVSSSNFFKTNSILTQSIKNTTSILKSKGNELYSIDNGKQFNKLALASRFYLENSLNAWLIDEYFKPINNNLFIYLKAEEFKNLLINKMVFDQDDLINQLINCFNKLDLEIKNEFLIIKEDYRDKLDYKISSIYSQGKIEKKVDYKYNTSLKYIDNNMTESIKKYIQNILYKVKSQMANEGKRLTEKVTSYSNDFSTITETIQNYKLEIYEKFKEIIDNIVNNTYENIMNIIYNYHFKIFLDEYKEKSYNFSLESKNYDTLKSSYNIGTIVYEIVEELINSYQNYTKNLIEIKKEKYLKKKYNEVKLDEIKKLIDDEISQGYSNLLEILNQQSTSNAGDNYDFKEEIKDSINLEINLNINNINNTLKSIQEDVNTLGWETLDFSDEEPFSTIETDFNTFITNKISLEKKNLNKNIEEIIYGNFVKVINNLILTFGKEYFERVMKYNENFRIKNLYQNLRYLIFSSVQYYTSLYSTKKEYGTLTKDLKLKLYNLNDLNDKAKEKMDKNLNYLENDIDDLIKNSFNYVLDTYIEDLENYVSLEEQFTKETKSQIISKALKMNSTLSKYYIDLLNKECKSQFIDSYKKVMNDQTNGMSQAIEDSKLKMKLKLDELFTVDMEKVLNRTNYLMNMTLDSIKEYETYFNSFKFPDNLLAFFDSYRNTSIQRAYDDLEAFINKLTKNETLSHLENNIKIFKDSLSLFKFVEDRNNIFTKIKNNNIDKIKDVINSYGKEEYPNKLNEEINRIQSRRIRRLNGGTTFIDIYEEIKEDLNEKSISQIFNNLYIKSENTINYVKTFESFDKFNEIIDKNIKKVNISYKEAKQIIDNVYSEDANIYQILDEKLEILKGYILNYYNTMKDSYNSLKKYIDNSLYEIDEELDLCTNVTYQTIIQKYENISKKYPPFDLKKNNKEPKDKLITYAKSLEMFDYEATVEITSINENARFKYDLILEGEGRIKEAKVIASVINQIQPLKARIEFNEYIPDSCAKKTQKIDIDFNKVNYTTNLFFDSKFNVMNVSFDKDFIYEYKLQGYETERNGDGEEPICNVFLGIIFCLNDNNNDNCNEPIKTNETEAKIIIIQENGRTLPINNLN